MVIDINPILKGEKNEIEVNYDLKINDDIGDVSFPDAFFVKGNVKDMAGYIALSLEADVKYSTNCARCLIPLKETMLVTFNKTVVTEEIALRNEDNDDYIISKDGFVDADEALIEQILLELPLRHLCKDDCKGLCQKCGANLNVESCSCDLSEPDPRFDVLRKLLDNNKS